LHERALPKIRKQPLEMAAIPPFPADLPPALVDLVASPIPVEMAGLEDAPVGPFENSVLPPGLILPPSGGFVVPPGQTSTPTPPVVTPPVVTPQAVPEPATWAMMLLGMSLIGLSLRGRSKWEQIAA
jgi:hypothetical protein